MQPVGNRKDDVAASSTANISANVPNTVATKSSNLVVDARTSKANPLRDIEGQRGL